MNHCIAKEEMEERASLYALGALSQHESRAFDEHLAEGCTKCAAILSDMESVVANLAFGAPEASPRLGLRDELLAVLETESSPDDSAEIPEYDDSSPVVVRAKEGTWQKMSAGVQFKQLFIDAARNTVTSLVKMEPGACIPMHRHLGIEECYVIAGDVSANNETLNAGDYTCAMAGSVHQPLSTTNGALLLIIAPERFETVSP